MINLLFDGNHFVHRSFMALDKTIQASQDGLLDIFIRNFKSSIRPFSTISSRIIFTVDHTSWRKGMFDGVEYKGNRKKDENPHIDWQLFYENYKKFQNELEKANIIIQRVPGAEADDLLYIWSHKLLSIGENSIIFTGDSDLKQLSEYNGNNWVIIADPAYNKSIYVTEDFNNSFLESNSNSIFEMNTSLIKNKLSNSEYSKQVNIIDPIKVLIHKILSGDKGDNIPSVYYRPAGGIGKSSVNKIIKKFIKYHGYTDLTKISTETWVKRMVKIIFAQFSISDISHTELISKIKRNRSLVYLHQKYIPSGVVEAATKEIDSSMNTKFTKMSDIESQPELSKTKLYKSQSSGIDYDGLDDFDIDDLKF